MTRNEPGLRWVLAALAVVVLSGCAGATSMSPQQQEGVELRRYCERTNDVNKCHGFMGFA